LDGCLGGPGFRPLHGNAGCARCAFAWAAPALGPLRCNPGYANARVARLRAEGP